MAEGADLVIYGMKGSPFVRKVQVLLAEKGVDFELEGVNIFSAPAWFAAINPAKRIPVLCDRSVGTEGVLGTIPDSAAICAYLERKHPERALYPKDAFAYGRALAEARGLRAAHPRPAELRRLHRRREPLVSAG